MKSFKVLCIATLVLFMLPFQSSAITGENEVEVICSEDTKSITLEIPELNYVKDVELLQSVSDAPLVIELISSDGINNRFLISSDGINNRFLISSDGINNRFLISSDGINNRFLISSDGINNRFLISSDGINNRTVGVTVTQGGYVILKDEI